MHRLRSVYNFIVLPFPGYAGVCKRRHLPLNLHQMFCSALIFYPTPPACRWLGWVRVVAGSACTDICAAAASPAPVSPSSRQSDRIFFENIPETTCRVSHSSVLWRATTPHGDTTPRGNIKTSSDMPVSWQVCRGLFPVCHGYSKTIEETL